MCPAVGQGVVVVEFLAANERVAAYLSKINHKPTEQCCLAERAMLRVLMGTATLPLPDMPGSAMAAYSCAVS